MLISDSGSKYVTGKVFCSLYAHAVDHSRVVLSIPDRQGSDYINASYINVRPTVDSEQTVCHVHYNTVMLQFMFHYTG